jgi:Zn-dependent protease with chaperone function
VSIAVGAPVLACGLAVVGLLAAGPASALLARAQWPARGPTAALVLWQSVCLCAGLALIGAMVVLAVQPLGPRLSAALMTLLRNVFDGTPLRGLPGWRVILLMLAGALAGFLLAVLIRCGLLALRRRRAHRELLDLLTLPAEPDGASRFPQGVQLLDHAAPVAYGVPGWHTRLVLTVGLVDLLTGRQLAAVVAHERAHLRAHHDLLLLPFQAWSAALGRLPGVNSARAAVAALAEMQADDAAARAVDPGTVASALAAVVLAGPGTPDLVRTEVPEIGSTAVVRRVSRLRDPRPLSAGRTLLVYLTALLVLLAPAVVLIIDWS